MTYKKFKEVMVEENNLEPKQINRLIVKVALFCLMMSLSVALVTLVMLSVNMAGLVIVLGGFSFLLILDYMADDKEALKKITKWSKFWWLSIILLAIIIAVLKLLFFI